MGDELNAPFFGENIERDYEPLAVNSYIVLQEGVAPNGMTGAVILAMCLVDGYVELCSKASALFKEPPVTHLVRIKPSPHSPKMEFHPVG